MTFTPAPVLMDIPLDRIDSTGGTQMRVRIDDATVLEYRERMLAGDEFPAIVVFREGAKHWLADGFHRYRARLNIGARDVRCEVRIGDRLDAIAYAVGANRSNGLRRTNADKQMAVRAALSLERFAEMSDRALAEIVGVADTMIGDARRGAGAAEPHLTEKRIGRDGKKYPAGKARLASAVITLTAESFDRVTDEIQNPAPNPALVSLFKKQTPRVAARGADPRKEPTVSMPLAVPSVNDEPPRVAATSNVLVAGESHVCPHCNGTGRIRGEKL